MYQTTSDLLCASAASQWPASSAVTDTMGFALPQMEVGG